MEETWGRGTTSATCAAECHDGAADNVNVEGGVDVEVHVKVDAAGLEPKLRG